MGEVTPAHIRLAERCVERPYNRGSVDRAAQVIADAIHLLEVERDHFKELADKGLEPRMKSMRLENGEVNLEVTGPMVEAMAMAYVLHFKGIGADNFVEFNIHDREEPRQRYTVTVQKVAGKSPADLLNECKAEVLSRDALFDEMVEALAFYADVGKYPAPLTGGMGDLWRDCGERARAVLAKAREAGK